MSHDIPNICRAFSPLGPFSSARVRLARDSTDSVRAAKARRRISWDSGSFTAEAEEEPGGCWVEVVARR